MPLRTGIALLEWIGHVNINSNIEGILGEVAWPEGIRVDTWVETGSEVTPYYDSLLAKLMVFAPTRKEAIAKLVDALSKTKVQSYIHEYSS